MNNFSGDEENNLIGKRRFIFLSLMFLIIALIAGSIWELEYQKHQKLEAIKQYNENIKDGDISMALLSPLIDLDKI